MGLDDALEGARRRKAEQEAAAQRRQREAARLAEQRKAEEARQQAAAEEALRQRDAQLTAWFDDYIRRYRIREVLREARDRYWHCGEIEEHHSYYHDYWYYSVAITFSYSEFVHEVVDIGEGDYEDKYYNQTINDDLSVNLTSTGGSLQKIEVVGRAGAHTVFIVPDDTTMRNRLEQLVAEDWVAREESGRPADLARAKKKIIDRHERRGRHWWGR